MPHYLIEELLIVTDENTIIGTEILKQGLHLTHAFRHLRQGLGAVPPESVDFNQLGLEGPDESRHVSVCEAEEPAELSLIGQTGVIESPSQVVLSCGCPHYRLGPQVGLPGQHIQDQRRLLMNLIRMCAAGDLPESEELVLALVGDETDQAQFLPAHFLKVLQHEPISALFVLQGEGEMYLDHFLSQSEPLGSPLDIARGGTADNFSQKLEFSVPLLIPSLQSVLQAFQEGQDEFLLADGCR